MTRYLDPEMMARIEAEDARRAQALPCAYCGAKGPRLTNGLCCWSRRLYESSGDLPGTVTHVAKHYQGHYETVCGEFAPWDKGTDYGISGLRSESALRAHGIDCEACIARSAMDPNG